MKTSRKVSTGRRPVLKARRAAPLSLTMRVERLEKIVLFPAPPVAKPTTRFTRLMVSGQSEHVAVYDAHTNLTWSAGVIGEGTWQEAQKLAADCRLLGQEGWRLPTIQELLALIDYDRYDPVVDPDLFRGPYGWTWTSTISALPSGCARCVSLGNGGSCIDLQGDRFRVRAVRAGQF
jgi:hypothetical protein